MQPITNTRTLREAIAILEVNQQIASKEVKEAFVQTFETFKPINIIKSSVRDLVVSPDLRNELLSATLGLGAGYLSKKVLTFGSTNPMVKVIGHLLEFGIAGLVSKNPEGLKAIASSLVTMIRGKKSIPKI